MSAPAEVEPTPPRRTRAERRRLLARFAAHAAARGRARRRRLLFAITVLASIALGILAALALRWPS